MKPIDVKVNVKPVFSQLVHASAYEGPCRVGTEEKLAPEAERQRGRESGERFVADLKKHLGPHARLMEPTSMEWSDSFVLPEREIAKLEPDVHDADLVLMGASGLPQYPAISVAHRYGKPVGMMGWVASVDVAAYLRARGMEGYAFLDYDHLNHVLSLVRARKAFRKTRFLVATEGNSMVPTGVVSSIWDMEGLKARYGVDYTCVAAGDIIREMDDLPEPDLEEAEELTSRLIENAEAVHMSREDVLASVKFYVAVRRTLERHEANGFVIPCFEICAKQVMAQKRVTFCLTHTLLKDAGIPSACEADNNVLMAIALLMYVSRKSVHMGNSYLVNRKENVLAVHHDVPGLRMKGLDEIDLPYEIRNFTVGGWGVTIRYDFARDKGAPVTLARFDPAGTRVLLIKGEIAGCGGFDRAGCALSAHVKVKDIEDLFEKELDFGHHLAMAYGDYARDVRELGRMMGFEVVEA